MPWIVYFIAGGHTFLPGAGLLALAVVVRAFFVGRWGRLFAVAIAVLGIVLVLVSAEAVAWWIYGVWSAATLAWFFREKFPPGRLKLMVDRAELAVKALVAVIAISYRRSPSLPPAAFARMYVIGDSVSAGIGGEGGVTWPGILAAKHRIQVVNLARAGATISDATRHLPSDSLADGLVLLEIGGNDIIGHVAADQFGQDLDALVQKIRSPSRQIVMLELPLFPFDNAYGIQQRRIASEYGALLIPREYFVEVIAAPSATLDGIHLSAAGQHIMAEMVWEMVGASLRPGSP